MLTFKWESKLNSIIMKSWLFAATLFISSAVHATVINGQFSNSLNGWTALGDTTVTASEEARLADEFDFTSELFQDVTLAAGAYTFEFDFLNELSPFNPGNVAGADTAFFSLGLQELFNLNALGVFDNTGADGTDVGEISASTAKGGDWQHYTLDFSTPGEVLTLSFLFFDQNFIDADSALSLDNISISAATVQTVPTPPTLALVLLATIALLARQRLR